MSTEEISGLVGVSHTDTAITPTDLAWSIMRITPGRLVASHSGVLIKYRLVVHMTNSLQLSQVVACFRISIGKLDNGHALYLRKQRHQAYIDEYGIEPVLYKSCSLCVSVLRENIPRISLGCWRSAQAFHLLHIAHLLFLFFHKR